jgi:translation initiation factor 2 alpha subunit (eIF-2alpha)
MEDQFEEGQLVLCTVDKVIGTTVFVKVEGNGEGTVTTSEIAPGRIRNLRDYVVPNKKIVCKILSIRGDKIQLSLRRVKPNERKELLDKVEKEKSYSAIIKTVIGKEEYEKVIEKILEEYSISDFFNEIKQNQQILNKFMNKEQSEKIIKILESKKEKPKEIRQLFRLSSKASNGILIIKDILKESCDDSKCNINYIAAGKYSISLSGEDFKTINNKIQIFLEKVETLAKKQHCDFIVEKS